MQGPLSPLINSEIDRLETVVVHTPGAEVEAMSPEAAERLLYNEIVPLASVLAEHRMLKDVLERFSPVIEVTDLLADALDTDRVNAAALVRAMHHAGAHAERLFELGPTELARTLICGLPAEHRSLDDLLSGRPYDIPPLPNLYFMRDSSFVVGDRYAVCAMAHTVRGNEALIMRTIFEHAGAVRVFDGPTLVGPSPGEPRVSIEGGDVAVLRRDLIVVGVSERTTGAAIDRLSSAIAADRGEPVTVLAVLLPAERRAIHLDMVFTMIDHDAALVYEPMVSGPGRAQVVRLECAPNAEPRIIPGEGLLEELAKVGLDLEPIACGGPSSPAREREQWLAGANVFALAPGVIVGYDCNVATIEALARAGFTTTTAEQFLSDSHGPASARLLIGVPGVNLARGGGGPRCMTLPVRRSSD